MSEVQSKVQNYQQGYYCYSDWLITGVLAFVLFLLLFAELLSPGVTWDEAFVNFDIAKRQAEWFSQLGELEAPFSNETITEYWKTSSDHPSLPRSIAAFFYLLFTPPLDEIVSLRMFSALLFSFLMASVFLFLRLWLPRAPALAGALSLALMPRVFGHAHFFSLDVPILCMWFWAALAAWFALYGNWPAWIFGLVYAFTFTTKLHAAFLPFPLLAWAAYVIFVEQQSGWKHYLKRALWMAGWAVLLTPILYVGLQPWLWHDTWARLVERFFGYATKTPIHIYYLGERYSDNTPWHYPLVMVGFTVPLTLLFFSLVGLFSPILFKLKWFQSKLFPLNQEGEVENAPRRAPAEPLAYPTREGEAPAEPLVHSTKEGEAPAEPLIKEQGKPTSLPQVGGDLERGERSNVNFLSRFLFLLLLFLTPLAIILLPLAQGYDGCRLFLPAFPFLACFVGWGFFITHRILSQWLRAPLSMALLFVALCLPTLLSYTKVRPFYLAYYNELAGGVHGANELGMETTYWCDALTRDFLEIINKETPQNGSLKTYALPYELIEYYKQREWLRPDIGYPRARDEDYHLIQFRQGFFVREEWGLVLSRDPIATVEIDGVPLIALYAPFR